jgi:phosphopantetheinyl transferase
LCGGDAADAAALLWALKEAAVKALGVGFHLLDPLAVEAFSPRPWRGGVRVSVQAGRILSAWARPEEGGWLALARNY